VSHRAQQIRNNLLDQYYREVYRPLLFGGGIQGCGISLFEKAVERHWQRSNPTRILELGAGSGEHMPFVAASGWGLYVALDLAPNRAVVPDHHRNRGRVAVVQGDAQELPFGDESFDRVVSTCLLHHVVDPMAVLMEVRRVMQPGAEFSVVLPTDPGMANRLVKVLSTYPRVRRLSDLDPRLVYALEHRNHIGGLISLIKYVFARDVLRIRFGPTRLPSWNANLWVTAHVLRTHDR